MTRGRTWWAICALAVVLGACGGGGGGPGTGGQIIPTDDVQHALADLEQSGDVPILDRGASVPGADTNGDGVRDDVGLYIDGLSDTEAQKDTLRELVRALDRAMELGGTTADVADIRAAAIALATANQCVRLAYPPGVGEDRIATIRAFVANTEERFLAYAAFDTKSAGLVIATPSADACGTGSPKPHFGTTESVCENRGYVVCYFNGVLNDGAAAEAGKAALQSLIGTTFDGEPVRYEVFHNHTGSEVGATFFQDLAETFTQRANELDTSGDLAHRFEFLWEIISDGEGTLWERLIGAVSAAQDLYDALVDDFVTEVAGLFGSLLSNPPTMDDYAEHRSRLDEFVLQGQKLLLVAHSQGNLFANAAYDYISPKADAGSVAVVHIAPASTSLRGSWVLNSGDQVINLLRNTSGNVPSANVVIPFSTADVTGHFLSETYLDGSRPGRAAVQAACTSAMSALVTPTAEASQGFFTVTLTWDGTGDVDLHTFEPGGEHVYYQNLGGIAGFLDVDNVVANGPEHYFASCDPSVLLVGTYQIGINNYNNATGRTATVQIATALDGVLLTKQLGVGPERGSSGNASPISVCTVTVSVDGDGNYSATAE